jgi:outer membrane protein OmpA-like peptidoglycan-associated protein
MPLVAPHRSAKTFISQTIKENAMKTILKGLALAFALPLVLSLSQPGWAQQDASLENKPAEVQAIKVISGTRESLAITYPEGITITLKFQGTQRLPFATGEAKVERKRGTTEIEIELDEIKPASLFGGDYNTYVLWTVTPEGHTINAGEFIVRGNRSKLNATTTLETFGMFITAEPHYLVPYPSRFVVMENTRPTRQLGGVVTTSQIKYREAEGVYQFEQETLSRSAEAKKEVRTDIAQARTAVALAERAGAARFAAEELNRAKVNLLKAEQGAALGTGVGTQMIQGKEIVRMAFEAQKLAEERSFQAALDAERKAKAEEAARLEKNIQEAQSDAERSRLLAEQEKMKREMEESARRASEAAKREAEAAAAKAAADAEAARRAKADADAAALLAQGQAEAARRRAEEASNKMEAALSRVVETRRTARGIILNLPDILFEFSKADLRPETREVLAKVSGILMVASGYHLSIEGHTDSVGSEEYNQKLSESRAEGVYQYLARSGVSNEIMTTRGFGKTQPRTSNDTAKGRQENRRVEIVIEDKEGDLKL